VGQLRETAQAKYRANQVTQQDVLQADLSWRSSTGDSSSWRGCSGGNCSHQYAPPPLADAPLPPPPASLDPPHQPPDANLLWQTALQQRPDLAALAWRVQSEWAALELAHKNFYPDFDAFWPL
jgi:outer membrane protein TolC